LFTDLLLLIFGQELISGLLTMDETKRMTADEMLQHAWTSVSPTVGFVNLSSLVVLWRRPLSSDRQHLSYDVCLEVRGEIIRTVLCCIVY